MTWKQDLITSFQLTVQKLKIFFCSKMVWTFSILLILFYFFLIGSQNQWFLWKVSYLCYGLSLYLINFLHEFLNQMQFEEFIDMMQFYARILHLKLYISVNNSIFFEKKSILYWSFVWLWLLFVGEVPLSTRSIDPVRTN